MSAIYTTAEFKTFIKRWRKRKHRYSLVITPMSRAYIRVEEVKQ